MNMMDIHLPVFGMVKDDKHRTRGLFSENGEIILSPLDSVFKFIANVQDEVHRSAITYHRKLRSSDLQKSELDEINGIGKVKKTKLLAHFKSIEKIKEAPLSELETVLDKKAALDVYNFFKEA